MNINVDNVTRRALETGKLKTIIAQDFVEKEKFDGGKFITLEQFESLPMAEKAKAMANGGRVVTDQEYADLDYKFRNLDKIHAAKLAEIQDRFSGE